MKRLVIAVAILLATSAPTVQAETGSVDAAIVEVAAAWGMNPNLARCVVAHESGGDPFAVSRTDDHGLLQFHRMRPGVYSVLSASPWAAYGPYNVWASLMAFHWAVATGQGEAWVADFKFCGRF